MLEVTAIYTALIGLMAIALGAIPGTMRGKTGISVGDGGNNALTLAMRRHANFVEWAPITLLVIGMLELQGVGATTIHVMGAGLVVCRLLHAIGVKYDSIKSIARAIGAFGNVVILAVASVWVLIRVLS